jgi:GT2 family glycosyltransferase
LSLQRTLDTIREQSFKGYSLRVDDSPEAFLDKTLKMAKESTADLVAICDDDAEFPTSWLEGLLKYFDLKDVGFAGGPMIPLVRSTSSRTERAAAFVTSSFFGSLWMSRRSKDGDVAEERTETGLVGVGVYRRSLLLKILEEGWAAIPRGAWETYVFTRMREMGSSTIFAPEGRFYHAPRTSFRLLAKQAFRSGVGRMGVFRSKPRLAIRAGSIVLPILGLAYFVEASSHAFYWPIILYLGLIFVAGGFDPWNFAALLAVHISYTSGLIVGIVKRDVNWI